MSFIHAIMVLVPDADHYYVHNIDLKISVKNYFTSSIYMNSGCDNCNNNTFFPNLNYHNFMVTNVCNTIYVYIYEKMYKNYINHFF